jgi:recombination protein RecA
MAAAATIPLARLSDEDVAALARLGVSTGTSALAPSGARLDLGWPELERILPDGGFPRGVVELAMPMTKQGAMRGGATTIALRAASAVHARDAKAWCAWITPTSVPSLHAPAVAAAGVDLDRLLVVRPDPAALARTVVKVAASGAFDLVVVDALSGLDGRLPAGWTSDEPSEASGRARRWKAKTDGSVIIRKLALFAEERGTTSIVLTNLYTPRPLPWPVALRLEVERRPDAIAVRITKDRRGRSSSQHVVRLLSSV